MMTMMVDNYEKYDDGQNDNDDDDDIVEEEEPRSMLLVVAVRIGGSRTRTVGLVVAA